MHIFIKLGLIVKRKVNGKFDSRVLFIVLPHIAYCFHFQMWLLGRPPLLSLL